MFSINKFNNGRGPPKTETAVNKIQSDKETSPSVKFDSERKWNLDGYY